MSDEILKGFLSVQPADDDLGHMLPEWLYVPELENLISPAEDLDSFLDNNSILLSVLDHINEGISILSPTRDILYLNKAMRRWYLEKDAPMRGRKCYRVFHNAKYACKNCPAFSSLTDKSPYSTIVEYRNSDQSKGKMHVHTTPILNQAGSVVLLLEYVQNVSFQYNVASSIENLQIRNDLLEKQNKLLLSSLAIREQQYDDLKTTIEKNIEQYVKPLLSYIKKNTENEQDYYLIKSILEHSFQTFTTRQSSEFSSFTAREMQVAHLIKDGLSSKEIADELFVSKKAVDFHRSSIRKKLGLDKNTNLKVYLEMHLK